MVKKGTMNIRNISICFTFLFVVHLYLLCLFAVSWYNIK
uniref:Uncharacterized protein n=1 Tax=Anguilla anguilla TaxID=7936 RepID=A0A0E9XMP2_ANGAN